MGNRVARRILIAGRVQGVAFRWSARRALARLGVVGWVRNLPGGRVEAWVEGEPEAVERALSWLAGGPPAARVTGTEVEEHSPAGLEGFEIR